MLTSLSCACTHLTFQSVGKNRVQHPEPCAAMASPLLGHCRRFVHWRESRQRSISSLAGSWPHTPLGTLEPSCAMLDYTGDYLCLTQSPPLPWPLSFLLGYLRGVGASLPKAEILSFIHNLPLGRRAP